MDNAKPLELDTLRMKIAKELYEDTFKDPGGPGWLTLPVDVRDGFLRMTAVVFDHMFKEDPRALTEFFVDEQLTREEIDLIIVQARQQGKTMRMMQQQNAFVQRAALFSMAEEMLKTLYDLVEDTPHASPVVLDELQKYTDVLAEIKEAADPARLRENARAVNAGRGEFGMVPNHELIEQKASNLEKSATILGADGKPMKGLD